jgi:hypothetical protein
MLIFILLPSGGSRDFRHTMLVTKGDLDRE